MRSFRRRAASSGTPVPTPTAGAAAGVPAVVVAVDGDGVCRLVGGDELLVPGGLEPMLDAPFRDFVHPDDRLVVPGPGPHGLEPLPGTSREHVVRVGSGGRYAALMVEAAPMATPGGGPGWMFTLTSPRDRADRLERVRRRDRMWSDAPIGLAVIDSRGYHLDVNPHYCDLIGYRADRLDTISLFDVFLGRVEPIRDLVSSSTSGRVILEGPLQPRSGDPIWVQLHAFNTSSRGSDAILCYVVDITELHSAGELTSAASESRDRLTGAYTREYALEHIDDWCRPPEGPPPVLAIVDFVGLRGINETLGDAAGDEALAAVASRLQHHADGAPVARLQATDFLLVLAHVDHDVLADRLAQLQALVEAPVETGSGRRTLAATIGAAASSDGVSGLGQLLHARQALAFARERGDRSIEIYREEIGTSLTDRLALRAEIGDAVRSGQLEVHYQPIHDAELETLIGVEALLRWRHPTRGLLPAADFLPAISQTPVGDAIDELVLDVGLRELARLQREGGWQRAFLAINLSSRQIADPLFADRIGELIERYELDPAGLAFEVTESAVLHDVDTAAETMHRLRVHGVHFALDDFGTGYSSLTHLSRLPIDIVKIDKSFVSKITEDGPDRSIALAAIQLAHALGMATVGEGVETVEQAAELRALGCDALQGFLIGRPDPSV